MRRRINLGACVLALGASVAASASRADSADTPEGLLQEGAKLAKYCQPPKPDWQKKKLSSNFDSCNDEMQALVKAIELSKRDAKTLEAASPSLAAASMNKSASALYIGRIYTEGSSQEAALGFFQVACASSESVSSFVKPTPEQAEAMKSVVAGAEEALQGYHRTCKTVAAPD